MDSKGILCAFKKSNLWSQSLGLSITENNIFSLKCGKKNTVTNTNSTKTEILRYV